MSNIIAFPKAKPHWATGYSRIIAVPRLDGFYYLLSLDDSEHAEEFERLDLVRRMAAFWSPTVIEEGRPKAFGRAGE
jgi:hypothetical protein